MVELTTEKKTEEFVVATDVVMSAFAAAKARADKVLTDDYKIWLDGLSKAEWKALDGRNESALLSDSACLTDSDALDDDCDVDAAA
jgi:hypothetical protein